MVSVHLSVPAWAHSGKPAAAGFAAVGPAGTRCRSSAAAARAAGECGQCHVVSVRR